MAVAVPLLLAACQQSAPPANNLGNQAAPSPKQTESDVGAAQRLVRALLGPGGEIRFSGARRSASEGVPIVCGFYERGGMRRRYIVVNGEEAFVEARMQPGQMDAAVREFCGEGRDNRPSPVTPLPENMQ